MFLRQLGLLSLVLLASSNALAERVFVKYRGEVDLAPFVCQWTVSSLVKRICYDRSKEYLLVNLQGTYYHYCRIPDGAVRAWLAAESLGRHYNAQIKGRYGCR